MVAGLLRQVIAPRQGWVEATMSLCSASLLFCLRTSAAPLTRHQCLQLPRALSLRKKQPNLWSLSPQTPSLTPHCLQNKVHRLSLAFKAQAELVDIPMPFPPPVSHLTCWVGVLLRSMSWSHWKPLQLDCHLLQEVFPDPIIQDSPLPPFAGASSNT